MVHHVADVWEHAPVVVTLNAHHVLVHAMEAVEKVIVDKHRVKIHVMPHAVRVLDVQEIAQIHAIHIARHHVWVIVVIAAKTRAISNVDHHATDSANTVVKIRVQAVVQTAVENVEMDAAHAWDHVLQHATVYVKFCVKHSVQDVRHLASSHVVQNA